MPDMSAPLAPKIPRSLRMSSGKTIRVATQPVIENEATSIPQSQPQEQAAVVAPASVPVPTAPTGEPAPAAVTAARTVRTVKRKRPKTPPKPVSGYARLPIGEKVLFFKHLSVMLDAGIPLQEALEVLLDQLMNKNIKAILAVAIADLSDGYQLSWSLAKFPKVFDPFLTNVMAVGEESGSLSQQLQYLATQLEKKQELDGKVRGALMYPVIVLLGAFGIGAYLAFFLLPKLIPMFMSLKIDLPVTTRLLIWLSQNLLLYWKWMVAGLITVIFAFSMLWRVKKFKYAVHVSVLKIPVFGKMARDLQIVQVARVLGTLLASGLHIVPALRVTRISVSNLSYEKELGKVANSVEQGENLASALREYPQLFSRTAVSMIGVGERTGRLSKSLLSLAEFYEREVDNVTKNLSSLIEPVLLSVVGIIVGFVALSIITPIYSLTQGLSR